MSLGEEKYVSVTTFRRSGVAVATPTWITPVEDGRVGFWTSSAAGKAKRLRNDPRVTVQPCDSRGRLTPGSESTAGTAVLVTSGPLFDSIKHQITAKYGFMVKASRLFNAIGHLGKGHHPYGDLGVVIALDD